MEETLEEITPEKIIGDDFDDSVIDDIVVDDVMSMASDITKTVSFIWNNYHFLCLTTLFFLLPLVAFLLKKLGVFNITNFLPVYMSEFITIEYLLVGLILINIIMSLLFWSNPMDGSIIHILDGFFAKFSLIIFVFYTLFYKQLSTYAIIVYLGILFVSLMFAGLSHYYSSQEWCCNLHVIFHGCMHFFFSLGVIMALA
jgi:hypothetical protein